MKNLILLILCSVMFSCGVRTKNTQKESSKTYTNEAISKMETTDFKSSSEVKTDLSNYLKESGLKINSIGKSYTLQYNGVIFSGDANLEFSDKEVKNVLKTITKTKVSYKSKKTYKSVTNYKTITTYKSMDLKSVRDSWWLYVLLYIAGMATIPLIKSFIKK